MQYLTQISETLKLFGRILLGAAERFWFDDGFSRAAALAYSALLALVPLTAISVQMLSSVNIGHQQALNAITDILERMLPAGENELVLDLQNQIFGVLGSLGSSVKDLSTVTVIILIVTAVALFNTIQSALDYVWRVQSASGVFQKIVAHWSVFTAWLLLIIVTVVWTARFGGLSDEFGFLNSESFSELTRMFPSILTWFTLTVLYAKVPSAPVRYRDAFLGALVSSILFEILKRAFAYYVGKSTSYSSLYGILASIPLFLFWLYLIWVVVLFGAHITYQSGSINLLRGLRRYATDLGEIGSLLGLRILQITTRRFINGKEAPTEGELAIETSSDPVLVRICLDLLTDAQILTLSDPEKHSRTLNKTPRVLKVGEVLETFRSKQTAWITSESDLKAGEMNATLTMFVNVAKGSNNKAIEELTLEEFTELS